VNRPALSVFSADGVVRRDCVVAGLWIIFIPVGVEEDEETRDDESICRRGCEGYSARGAKRILRKSSEMPDLGDGLRAGKVASSACHGGMPMGAGDVLDPGKPGRADVGKVGLSRGSGTGGGRPGGSISPMKIGISRPMIFGPA
jgi:hypothetical protein